MNSFGIFEIIPFIHFYPHGYAHGRSLGHILDEIIKWHFHSTSNKVIWPQKIQILSTGKKCHFDNFSEWAGVAVPC